MKLRKSIFLPTIITIYFVIMAFWFGRELIAAGRIGQFATICGVEIVVIIAMAIFLRKREKITGK